MEKTPTTTQRDEAIGHIMKKGNGTALGLCFLSSIEEDNKHDRDGMNDALLKIGVKGSLPKKEGFNRVIHCNYNYYTPEEDSDECSAFYLKYSDVDDWKGEPIRVDERMVSMDLDKKQLAALDGIVRKRSPTRGADVDHPLVAKSGNEMADSCIGQVLVRDDDPLFNAYFEDGTLGPLQAVGGCEGRTPRRRRCKEDIERGFEHLEYMRSNILKKVSSHDPSVKAFELLWMESEIANTKERLDEYK